MSSAFVHITPTDLWGIWVPSERGWWVGGSLVYGSEGAAQDRIRERARNGDAFDHERPERVVLRCEVDTTRLVPVASAVVLSPDEAPQNQEAQRG